MRMLLEVGWKYIFAVAVLLMAINMGISPAQSFNGPSISLESNPVFNYYENNWSGFATGKKSLNFNIPSGQVLIITKFVTSDSDCFIDIDGVRLNTHDIEQLKIDASMAVALESRYPGDNSYKCGQTGSIYENIIYVEGYYSKE